VATKNGNTAIVEALLKAAGVDVNIQSEVWVKVWGVQDGWTPLIHAAANGHFATVKVLLAAGVDVNVQKKVGTFSPTSSAPPPTASPAGVSSDEASHDGGGSHVAALTAL
jgi:ankyrin repeat protein